MVLFEIDSTGVGCVEFECDAPGSVDVNRVASRTETLECMKIETRQVHLSRGSGRI